MKFLRNVWYMSGWADELVPGRLLSRTILNEPVVLYRKQDGTPAALHDRCPHRFAPLSAGRQQGDSIECGYHGLKFDCNGACESNPHGQIPRNATVKAYPVYELYGIVWIWMGDAALSNPASIPDLSELAAARDSTRSKGYLPTDGNYQLIVDNVADLSHVDYLHPSALGGGVFTRARPKVEEIGESVHISWWSAADIAPPAYDMFMPEPGMKVDFWTEVWWHAPGVMPLNIFCTPAGSPREDGIETHNVHIVTPETDETTHYWFCLTRSYRTDDLAITEKRQEIMFKVFRNEDKPMIEAQQKHIGPRDLFELKPLLLPTDAGAVRIRRVLERLVNNEQSGISVTEERPRPLGPANNDIEVAAARCRYGG
jgi:phenylpropionate dioxygenase-like ring-hydroxylating dioxygenase large terminal subunit